MREVASTNGVEVFSASAGRKLDELPRVGIESLFDGGRAQSAQST